MDICQAGNRAAHHSSCAVTMMAGFLRSQPQKVNMNFMWLKCATAIALFLWLALPIELTAQDKDVQQPPAQNNTPFKFSAGTNMVLVPVVVSDKRGQHVSGLTADDFEVREAF